jgi:hypothetical protein
MTPDLDVLHVKDCVFAAADKLLQPRSEQAGHLLFGRVGDEISARQTLLVLLLRFTQARRNESGAFPDFLTGHAGAQLPLIGHRFSEKRLGS